MWWRILLIGLVDVLVLVGLFVPTKRVEVGVDLPPAAVTPPPQVIEYGLVWAGSLIGSALILILIGLNVLALRWAFRSRKASHPGQARVFQRPIGRANRLP